MLQYSTKSRQLSLEVLADFGLKKPPKSLPEIQNIQLKLDRALLVLSLPLGVIFDALRARISFTLEAIL